MNVTSGIKCKMKSSVLRTIAISVLFAFLYLVAIANNDLTLVDILTTLLS
ncbi:MAG: hypothetical protein PQJ44_09790 [Sphaerochaetaceae bacterium]|nr:hypothetical protein [Sphaerochaetaceae bacterium]